MTIKSHIAISVTISLALIALVACQQKPQPTEEEKSLNDKIKTQVTKVEDTAKKAQKAASKSETEAKEAAKKVEEEAKATEVKVNEEIKEIETKVEEATEKIESEINTIENKSENTDESKEGRGPKNILVNSDFSDGLDNWGHDKNVSIIDINGKKSVEIIGPSKGQNRIWQTINTISGHVYRLSFQVKAEQKGAFAIFRDNKNNLEKYLFAGASETWKEYTKDFKSNKNGNYVLYLSCNLPGFFYFSDPSLIDISASEE